MVFVLFCFGLFYVRLYLVCVSTKVLFFWWTWVHHSGATHPQVARRWRFYQRNSIAKLEQAVTLPNADLGDVAAELAQRKYYIFRQVGTRRAVPLQMAVLHVHYATHLF